MKAHVYKEFFKDGRYGSASKVMVQLKEPGTMSATLDSRRELTVATMKGLDPNMVRQAAQQIGRELTDEELSQLPMREGIVPPLPVLIGELEPIGEDLLLLTYSGQGRRYRVTLVPEDIKHITVPESTNILT